MTLKRITILAIVSTAILCAWQVIPPQRLILTGGFSPTVVSLRASPPASVQINGATGSGNLIISTGNNLGQLNHNFSTNCGTSITCKAIIAGMCANNGPSVGNGIHLVAYVDASHLQVLDLSGNPVTANGTWCLGSLSFSAGGGQWIGQLTDFTLGAQPLGWFDGPNGDLMRRVSLRSSNGLIAFSTAGCPSNCVVTIGLSYDATNSSTNKFPIASGQHFSITGTGTNLDTCGDGSQGPGAQSPYTMASVSSSGWTSNPFPCSGLAGGTVDYMNINNTCGPSPAPNDLIGGTQPCPSISQMAWVGNGWWTGLITLQGTRYTTTAAAYESPFDGGTDINNLPNYAWGSMFNGAAVRLLVDPTNQFWLTQMLYALNHIERTDGVSWTLYGQTGGLFPGGFLASQYGSLNFLGVSLIYSIAAPYWNATEKQTFLNKIYNNLDDPAVTACSTAGPDATGHWNTLVTDLAQAGDSTHITLSLADSQGPGYYVGTAVMLGSNAPYSAHCYGTVSAYNSSTKVATVNSWSGTGDSGGHCTDGTIAPPSNGSRYYIFSGGTVASAANGAATTITGVHTTFTSSLHVGDGIILSNDWPAFASSAVPPLSYVTAITDDTHISVINSVLNGAGASTSLSQQVWYLPAITTGDCGYMWGLQHAIGFPGAEPIIQTPDGGQGLLISSGIEEGGNISWIQSLGPMLMDLVAAPDDARAVRDLATQQSYLFDYMLAHYMSYMTGFAHSGADYSVDSIQTHIGTFTMALLNSIPSFPSIDITGPWAMGQSLKNVFGIYPDSNDGNPWFQIWGNNVSFGSFQGHGDVYMNGLSFDPAFYANPGSPNAAYMRNWMEHLPGFSRWGLEGMTDYTAAMNFLHNDPRVPSSDYTAIPHQYVWNTSSASTAASLTGRTYPAGWRGDAMISRSGFTSSTDTMVYFGSKSIANDYDFLAQNTLRIYQVGCLLCSDLSSPGWDLWPSWDASVTGDTPAIGSPPTKFVKGLIDSAPYGGQLGPTPINQWGSPNHGTWPSQFGDQNSEYVVACADISGNYDQAAIGTTISYLNRCVVETKRAGNDHFLADVIDGAVTSAVPMSYHLHYNNNGQNYLNQSRTAGSAATTCPGGGGCASLNSNRVVQSLQGGTSVGSGPTQNFGIITHFDSPGTITVQDDCTVPTVHAGGQCAPGDTYPGGFGYSKRITVAGGSSVGGNTSSMVSVVEHKFAQNLSDTTFTTTALNPDSHWTGFQGCGATSCAVIVLSLSNANYGAITSFTTTHGANSSHPTQYVVKGLADGLYTCSVGPTVCPGSPFTVTAATGSTLAFDFPGAGGLVTIPQINPVGGSTFKGTMGGTGTIHLRLFR